MDKQQVGKEALWSQCLNESLPLINRREALRLLVEKYHSSIVAYLREDQDHSVESGAQAFIEHLYEKLPEAKVGLFRHFLLAELSHFAQGSPCGDAQTFEELWLHNLMGTVHDRLRQEQEAGGNRSKRYEELIRFLEDLPEEEYDRVAKRLNVEVEALRMEVERLRRRFGLLLREEVAQTVADSHLVNEEIRYLFYRSL